MSTHFFFYAPGNAHFPAVFLKATFEDVCFLDFIKKT